MQQKYIDVRVDRVNETFVIHTGRGSVLAQTLRNTVMGRYSPHHEAMVVPGRFEKKMQKIMVNYASRRAEQIASICQKEGGAEDPQKCVAGRKVPASVISLLDHLRAA